MLLKKIKFHNFRPFIGDQEINLTSSDNNKDKNVIVILGDNTYGKSTFVLAFVWCLYGENKFNMKNILNRKVESEMVSGQQETASVEIYFEENNIEYVITRTQSFKMSENGQLIDGYTDAKLVYTTENGERKKLGAYPGEINPVINAILPKDLSSFFFFEGEKENNLSKKNLSESVRTLLGLEAYSNMKVHLHGDTNNVSVNSVMGYFLNRQNALSDSKTQEEYNRMVNAQAEIKKIDIRLEELDSEIKKWEKEEQDCTDKLKEYAPTKELQKRREAIAAHMKTLENNLNERYRDILREFSNESLPLFIMPLVAKTIVRLKEMDVADKGIKGLDVIAINELLARGICLCGTTLTEGSLAYNSVKKYIDFIPPRNVGTIVRDMIEMLELNKGKAIDFVSKFEELYKKIQTIKVNLDNAERQYQSVEQQINDIGDVDIQFVEKNLMQAKNTLKMLREEQGMKKSAKEAKKHEAENAEQRFNATKSKNDKAMQYQKYYMYAKAIYDWVDQRYKVEESDMRDRLNKYIQEIFNGMYEDENDSNLDKTTNRNHRVIKIDDKYNIDMRYKGEILDDTGGLRVIKYFSYIASIVKLANEVRKKKEKDNDLIIEAEQYPLVLDAAFSHSDHIRTKNIARELSNAATQLIFALMHKDWNYARDGLIGKVARVYELNKINDTEVMIKEVE